MMGRESCGMILCVDGPDGSVRLMFPADDAVVGSRLS